MIRASAWSLVHQVVGRAGMFVFFLSLPVLLPMESVGRMTFWYTLLLVCLQPLIEVGFGTSITKAVAREDWSRARTALRLGVLLVVVAAALWLAVAIPLGAPSPMALWLMGAVVGGVVLSLFFSLCRGRGDFLPEGLAGTLGKLSAPALLFGLVAMGSASEHGAAAALAASVAVAWLVALSLRGRWRTVRLRLRVPRAPWSPVAREGLVLGSAALVGLLSFRLDIVVLGLLTDEATVGAYFTSLKWLEAAFVGPHALMLVVLPRIAASARPRQLVRPLLAGALGLGSVATAATWSVARWGFPLVYGEEAMAMAPILMVLALSVVPVYCGILFTQSLVAVDRYRAYLIIAVVGLTLNLFGDLTLIPRLGPRGAAYATVGSEIFIALACAVAFYWTRSGGRE